MSGKDEFIEATGVIVDVLPRAQFKVKLDKYDNMYVVATMKGKMQMRNIRLTRGDSVQLEISPYDLTRARITYRNKDVSRQNPPANLENAGKIE